MIIRRNSEEFLMPWEPEITRNFYSLRNFRARVKWAKASFRDKKAVSFFIFTKFDDVLVGSITLDNIRRGSSQSASIGYWIGYNFARNGFMTEALLAIISYGFRKLELSRLEAATLPENTPSRRLLERTGFKYEGIAQSYIQINGRWRNHVMYSMLRDDRRGRIENMGSKNEG